MSGLPLPVARSAKEAVELDLFEPIKDGGCLAERIGRMCRSQGKDSHASRVGRLDPGRRVLEGEAAVRGEVQGRGGIQVGLRMRVG